VPQEIVIIGAGGHGREMHDVIEAINAASVTPPWDFLGFIDDGQPDLDQLQRRGATLLGGRAELATLKDVHFIVGIGSPVARRQVDAVACVVGLRPATLIHPSATIGTDVDLAAGVVVCSHVSVTTHVRVGRHTHLNVNSTVSHDVALGDFVTLSPGVTLAGNVTLADDVTMGVSSTVIPGVSIGHGATVGAGGVVVGDLAARVTAVGVPARPIGRH